MAGSVKEIADRKGLRLEGSWKHRNNSDARRVEVVNPHEKAVNVL